MKVTYVANGHLFWIPILRYHFAKDKFRSVNVHLVQPFGAHHMVNPFALEYNHSSSEPCIYGEG